MRWILAVVVLAVSGGFLYYEYRQMNAPVAQTPAAPPAVSLKDAPSPFLSLQEVENVRRSLKDGDSGIRWAAVELLYTIKDSESIAVLEKTVTDDPDPEMRMKAVALLNQGGSSRQVPGLIKALSDIEMPVRIAALRSLGEIADPAAAPYVSALLKDPENEVRSEALKTLGRFEDRRLQEFQRLTEDLRRHYEAAVRKSRGG